MHLDARARGRPLPRSYPGGAQPDAQRRQYRAGIIRLVLVPAEKLLNRAVQPFLAELREGSAVRQDANPGEVRSVFRDMAEHLLEATPNAQLAALARTAATETSTFQRLQMRRAFQSQLSVDVDEVFKEEPGLRREVDDFTVENVRLIRSVPATYFAEVESLVLEAVGQGWRADKLARLIAERTGVALSSAERIARDQVGKFHGALNARRQQALGITRYRWRTQRDNRVRSQHAARNGDTFSWDAPPEDGHPGHPINCRCTAEPVLDEETTEKVEKAVEAASDNSWRRLGQRKPVERAPRATRPPRPPRAPPGPRMPPTPNPLPHGPVRGDGARVAEQHPQLAALLGDVLRVDEPDDFDVRRQVRALASLPAGLLNHMRDVINDVHIGTGSVTDMGRSGNFAAERGVKASGPEWRGRTLDVTGGAYRTQDKEVLISVRGQGHGASAVAVLHELGHAVDFEGVPGKGIQSAKKEFRGIWERFKEGGYGYSRVPYFLQEWPVGAHELFAEAFGVLYDDGPDKVRALFGPEVLSYMESRWGRRKWGKVRESGGRKT